MARRPIRIANFSGALGDWVPAFSAAVRGEPVDVVTGDYLAEVTMAMVAARFCEADAEAEIKGYYVDVFLHQIVLELEEIAKRGIKVVVNAGAFNPAGLAQAVRAAVAERGLDLRTAHVIGDDLYPRLAELTGKGQLGSLETGLPLSPLFDQVVAANAYLGGWGITAALERGADIVICGRVSDASLVSGPAAWWHGWARDDWDCLAGAVVAGHVIECGPQAVGGQFSGFLETGTPIRIGHPIAEIEADGSCVITKRSGDGGAVTTDTVTAQLVYEIQGPDYLNPDVIAHFDSVQISQDGLDRVRLTGITGRVPPTTTKLGCFYRNGWQVSFIVFVTAPDTDAKIDWFRRQMSSVADTLELDEYFFDVIGRPADDPRNKAEATVAVRVAASAQDRMELQKLRGALGGFGMGGIPGFFGDGGRDPAVRVDFWPGRVEQAEIRQQMVLDGLDAFDIAVVEGQTYTPRVARTVERSAPGFSGRTRRVALGEIVHARSGDKGANASLGVWVRDARAHDWLCDFLTEQELARLIDLQQEVRVTRFDMPNIGGLLFALNGYFGVSGSGNVALDNLGKAIGEFLRARMVDVPIELPDG